MFFQLLLTLRKVKKKDTVTCENDALLLGNSPVVFVFNPWAEMT